jgi:hypothetical protein
VAKRFKAEVKGWWLSGIELVQVIDQTLQVTCHIFIKGLNSRDF